MTTTIPTPPSPSGHGYISDKDRYLARLKRIEGQARGIHRMVTRTPTALTSSPRSARSPRPWRT